MRVLQGNLHRSYVASNVLEQLVYQHGIDLVLVSEQYQAKDSAVWFPDTTSTAAVWCCNPGLRVEANGYGDGFAWVKVGTCTFVSCYFTPNQSINQFQERLDGLEDCLNSMHGHVMVGGDFNSKAVEWGMPVPDSRGRRLMEAAARLCLTVLNVGNVSTFRRVGCSGTIPDVTFASESLLPLTRNWKVMEDYTGSDHQYITVELTNAEPRIKVSRPPRWNVLRMDRRKLVASLEDRDAVLPEDHPSPRELAEAMAKGMVKCLQEACSKAMPRKKYRVTAAQPTGGIARLQSSEGPAIGSAGAQ